MCALVMYHIIIDGMTNRSIMYNLCAFALQMPLGIIADGIISTTRKNSGMIFNILSVPFILVGGLMPSAVFLGIGNALFHVGGGILTIGVDDKEKYKGRGLGTFVAPGALGLICGNLLRTEHLMLIFIVALAAFLFLYVILIREHYDFEPQSVKESVSTGKYADVILVCFLVVVLRSFAGMTISYSWKTSPLLIVISVIALAFGKTAGGFLAAEIGMKKTTLISLTAAAICFIFKDNVIPGLMSLILFNMTMPLTLYLLAKKMKGMPGTAFGILTFALFIGYYPTAVAKLSLDGRIIGVVSCLISLIALLYVERKTE